MDPIQLAAEAEYAWLPFVRIFVALTSIYICWWALQGLRFERFVHEPGSPQAKALHLILAVILGYHFSAFLIDYFTWTLQP
jgi:uncharacterized integral membrane protein (TIGR02327 family)